jgi:hypothetical protein
MNLRPYFREAWATRPAVVVASGPSLSDDQLCHVEFSRAAERCHVIAVNNTAERVPFADVVYFGDYTAIKHYRPKLSWHRGEWVTQDRASAERWRLTHIKPANTSGMCLQRVHLNGNSGAQAVNVAACFGAQRVVLLGFDMRADPKTSKHHWFGQHVNPLVQKQLYGEWLNKFEAIAADAKKLGIEIVNATPNSALTLFQMAQIVEAL